MAPARKGRRIAGLALALALMPVAASADLLSFEVAGGDAALLKALQNASLLSGAEAEGTTDPADLMAAARADYSRLLNALYAEGHYGGVIHIFVDGREAAAVSPFAAPARIGQIRIAVEPGPQFRFSRAEVTPLPAAATPTPGFRPGEIAYSTEVTDAVASGISDWREAGRAKAEVSDQRIVADHRVSTLDARILLSPGPLVRFGTLTQLTPSAVRAERIARIAGLPSGEVFSPEELSAAAERLRRTGAFASVTMTEAETLGPGDTMDIGLSLADAAPRRFGFGVEVSSLDGATLSGFWLHRNLFGGAERFRVDAEISNITGAIAGMDYSLSARLDIPAAFGTGIDAYLAASADYLDEPAYLLMQGGGEAGLSRRFSDRLQGTLGVAYRYEVADDDLGHRQFSILSLPGSLTWDGRDSALDATKGLYLQADLEPFHDFSGGAYGLHGRLDGRSYFGLADDRFVIATRAQIGAVLGAAGADVPPDYLFYSGGGGTVRGFPYQSLGVDLGGGTTIGGRAFLGLSGELRYRVTDKIGLVGFADAGHIGADTFFDGGGGWQVGAGLGLRYDTGIGPIRLDVAMPVSGPGGDGVQFYLGIGQAF